MKTIVLCSCLALAGLAPLRADEKKPVPTYTNADLERVSPLRGQTGALSEPGPTPDPGPAAPRTRSRSSAGDGHDETYWRREAARVQGRVQALRRKASGLRIQVAEARRRAQESQNHGSRRGAQASRGSSTASLEQRLQAAEDEARERESDLEERARRAGALPGWLR